MGTVRAAVVGLILVLPLLAGCREQAFHDPQKLGGKMVAAETLNRGKEVYTLSCRACHGDKGDGTGHAAPGYWPPPRDFTAGVFEFGGVASGDLPTDEALRRVTRYGLHGTAMLGWDLDDGDLDAVVQYLKTFSARWREEQPGDPIVPTPDPWRTPGSSREADAVARGAKVYHGMAQCSSCHPAYETRQNIDRDSREMGGSGVASFRADLYASQLKASDFVDRNGPDGGVKIALLPTDFLFDEVRSVRDLSDPANASADLYRVIAGGIGGTAMPQWKGALSEEDLWALVHYVRSLMLLRDTAGATAVRARLAGSSQGP